MALFDDVPDDELTLDQVAELEQSDDPADVERAARITAPITDMFRAATRDLIKLPKVDFGFAKLHAFEGTGEQWRREQEELTRSIEDLDRVMDELAEANAEREHRRADAEGAMIESARLLEVMVSRARAQSAQLAAASTLLQAIATQAAVSSEQEGQRWRQMWPVMRWSLAAAVVAALGSLGAILATLLSS